MRPGDQVHGYLFESLIGEGGMGQVWKARHAHLGTFVAIKIMAPHLSQDPSFAARFLQEAKTMARLDHPQIVGVKDFFEEKGEKYLVMPFVDGEPLDNLLDRQGGPLPLQQAVDIAVSSLQGLNHAHQHKVIHRDVKPSNILVDREGKAHITDFGIALMIGEERKTRTGTTIGTPHYMSPEQITKPKAIDHRSDVYSFGCVLYEMLCGRPPFLGEGEEETDWGIHQAHVNRSPEPPRSFNPTIPPAIEKVMLRALSKEPEQRFSGCGEFAKALKESVSEAQSPPLTTPTAYRPPKQKEGGTVVEPSYAPPPPAVSHTALPQVSSSSSGLTVGLVFGGIALVTIGFLLYWFVFRDTFLQDIETAIASDNSGRSAVALYDKREAEKPGDPKLREAAQKIRNLVEPKGESALQAWYSESEIPEGWEELERYYTFLSDKYPGEPAFPARRDYAKAQQAFEKKDFDGARGLYESALKNQPNWVLALNGIGKCYLNLGNRDALRRNDFHAQAERYYREATVADANFCWAFRNLGAFFVQHRKDYSIAYPMYQRAFQLKSSSPTIAREYAQVAEKIGLYCEAIKAYNAAIQNESNESLIADSRSKIRYLQGRASC